MVVESVRFTVDVWLSVRLSMVVSENSVSLNSNSSDISSGSSCSSDVISSVGSAIVDLVALAPGFVDELRSWVCYIKQMS